MDEEKVAKWAHQSLGNETKSQYCTQDKNTKGFIKSQSPSSTITSIEVLSASRGTENEGLAFGTGSKINSNENEKVLKFNGMS